MPQGARPETRYASLLLILTLIPASFNLSLAALLFIPATAAVIYLWFSRSHLPLGIAVCVTLISVALIFGIIQGLFLLIACFIPAGIIAEMQRRGRGFSATIAIGILPVGIAVGANLGFFKKLFSLLSDQMVAMVNEPQLAEIYSGREIEVLNHSMKWLTDSILMLFPSMLLTFEAVLLFCGLVVGIYLVRRNGLFARGIKDVALWKLPEWLLIPLGIAVIFVLTNQHLLAIIGWNVLFLLSILYSLCGLSLLEYLMRKWRFPFSVKLLVYLVLFLTQIVAAILLPLLAMFDSRFDYRRVKAREIG